MFLIIRQSRKRIHLLCLFTINIVIGELAHELTPVDCK